MTGAHDRRAAGQPHQACRGAHTPSASSPMPHGGRTEPQAQTDLAPALQHGQTEAGTEQDQEPQAAHEAGHPPAHEPEPEAHEAAPSPEPEPEPQLLLGLPPLALHVLLGALTAADKVALLHTCKEARAAVLRHATQLTCIAGMVGLGVHAELYTLLSTRTEALALKLDLTNADPADISVMLQQLATQQHPTPSGHCCVKELALFLPYKRATEQGSKDEDNRWSWMTYREDQIPVHQAWMQFVGPAFPLLTRLQVCTRHMCPSHLPASFFAGLSSCPNLEHLSLLKYGGMRSAWEYDPELSAQPEQLRQWLPNVRQLECTGDSGVLPLMQGLGPQLTALSLVRALPTARGSTELGGMTLYALRNSQLYDQDATRLAQALASCQQLQRISLHQITQPLLDVLVQLPALTHVETVTGTRQQEPLQQPRVTSQSGWQELLLGGKADQRTGCSMDISQLAMFPLGTTQQVAVHEGEGGMFLATQLLGATAADTAQARAEQQRIIAAVAGVPDLQWGGDLGLQVWDSTSWLRVDEEWPEAGGLAASVPRTPMQRLHQIIADCAPLAARACYLLELDLSPFLCLQMDLSGVTLAVIGSTFGETLASLHLNVDGTGISSSFWPALSHLPHLHTLEISRWAVTSADSLAALAGLAATYSGQPLTITFRLLSAPAAAALRAAPALQTADSDYHMLQLQLPQL